LIFLLFTSGIICQVKSDFKIYQFFGNDSINGHISKIVKYNAKGQLVFEKLSDYKTSKYNGFSDVSTTNFYKDTLLIKTLKAYPRGIVKDSVRIEFIYNEQKQLIGKTYFDFKKRLKKDLEFGDCLIDSTDYQPEPTWEVYSKIKFTYNKQGQKIEYYAPEYHWDSQNRYLYFYDNKDRIIKESSLNHDEIVWLKYYSYVENGYDYILDWDGKFEIETIADWPYKYEVRFKNDSRGNKIEETASKKDGSQDYRIVRTFDNSNRITSEKRYDSNDNIELTKIYIYE